MRIQSLVVAALLMGRAGGARAQEVKPSPPPASAQPPSPPPPEALPPAPAAEGERAAPPADAATPAPPATPATEAPAAGPPTPQTAGEAPAATGAPAASEAPPPPPAVAPSGLLDEEHPSRLRIAAWVTTAAAVALLAAGAIVGLAAQERADEISRQQLSLDSDNQTARFTPTVEQRIHDLRSEGQTYNALAIGMLSAAGAAAVASVVLFVVDRKERRRAPEASQRSGPRTVAAPRAEGLAARLRLLPSVSAQGAGLGAALVF